MSGATYRRISTNTPLILMVDMSLSYQMWVCMKAFGMYTVATPRFSSAYMTHLIRTDSAETVGKLASSLYIKYLCLFPPATVMPFFVPSIFYLRKRWESSILFLCSSVRYLLCKGMDVSLICIYLIYEWTYPLTLLNHFLRPEAS